MGSGISPGVTLAVYEDMAGKMFSVGEAFVLLGFASILIPIFMAEPGVRGWFARTNSRLAELVGLPVVASNWQLSMRKAQPVIRVALGAVVTALIMFLPIHIWGMIGIVVGGLLVWWVTAILETNPTSVEIRVDIDAANVGTDPAFAG